MRIEDRRSRVALRALTLASILDLQSSTVFVFAFIIVRALDKSIFVCRRRACGQLWRRRSSYRLRRRSTLPLFPDNRGKAHPFAKRRRLEHWLEQDSVFKSPIRKKCAPGFVMIGRRAYDGHPIQENGEMKTTMFILLAMFVSMLQSSGGFQEEPDIVVQNFEWGVLRQTSFTQPIDSTSEKSGRPEDRIPGESVPISEIDPRTGRRGETTKQTVTRNETYALVKNVGAKITKAVEWEYIFFSDVDNQKELKRYKFRNKIKIAPGETKFLSKEVGDRAVSRRQKVNIIRIEYTDSSIWQRAKSKSEP